MGTMWMSPLVSHKSFSSTFCHFFISKFYLTVMGTSGLEPPTSRLSGVRSNHLSYAPILKMPEGIFKTVEFCFEVDDLDSASGTAKRRGFVHLFFNRSFCLLTNSFGVTVRSLTLSLMVEMRRIELLTPCLQSRCSPS